MAGSNTVKPKVASAPPQRSSTTGASTKTSVAPQKSTAPSPFRNGNSSPDSVVLSPEARSQNGESSRTGNNLMAAMGFAEPGSVSSEPQEAESSQRTGREPVENFKYDGQAPGDYRGAVNSPRGRRR